MYKMCGKQWKISGHITVETALLLPAIILWIIWLMLFMIFLMDMAVVKSESIRLSDEISMIRNKNGSLETGEYILSEGDSLPGETVMSGSKSRLQSSGASRLESRIKKRLVLTSCENIHVSTGSRYCEASGTVSFHWPFGREGLAVETGIGETGLQFTAKALAPVNNWEELIRAADAIKNRKRRGKDG